MRGPVEALLVSFGGQADKPAFARAFKEPVKAQHQFRPSCLTGVEQGFLFQKSVEMAIELLHRRNDS